MKAKIEITLKNVISHKQEYEEGIEFVEDTQIESLIYDKDGNIIASDDSCDTYTKEYFVRKNGDKIISKESSKDLIIKSYLSTIKHFLNRIDEYKGNFVEFSKQLSKSELDWEDIEHNENLWTQYKPLYDLLTNKGYKLELQLI